MLFNMHKKFFIFVIHTINTPKQEYLFCLMFTNALKELDKFI